MQWICVALRQLLILASFIVIKCMEHAILADTLKFTNEPNSTIYVRNSSPFFVPCEATGEESLKIAWRNESVLNARVVINTTNRGLWFMRGVRPLRSPKVHRVGIFRCMATNTAGVVMSKKFELNFIYLQNISVHLSSPAFFNNIVRLKCFVETNQPVAYKWFKNNITLDASRDSRLQVLPSGVLRIRDYRVSDDGSYSCRAENAYKAINSREVTVAGQSPSKTEVNVYPGQDVQTVVGKPLVIECIQNGLQKSHVTWFKVMKKLGTRTLVNRTRNPDLVFNSVQKSDAGEYCCRATDGEEKTVFVSVGVPPSFGERLPATTQQIEREKLIIKCRASGLPTPSVTWYKDGQVIAENARIRFRGNGSEYSGLVVENVTVDDKGVYQCEIENAHGSSIQQTMVDIKYRKDPPYDVRGYPISSWMVNITWKIPSSYKTVYFAVHVFDYMRKIDFQEVTSDHATYLVLKDLRPYTEYVIYVKMYADERERGESAAFPVRTLETKPMGVPQEINLTSYSNGTLDVTWLPPKQTKRNGIIIGYEITYLAKGDSKAKCLATTKNIYSTTLRNLVGGKEYTVKIAARTKVGQGPFSQERSHVVSRKSTSTVIPAPLVTVQNVGSDNMSIVVSVTSPSMVHVIRYRMIYKLMGEYIKSGTEIIKNGSTFEYTLPKVELHAEYAITVIAFDSMMRKSRPTILVVSASVPLKANSTFSLNNSYLTITCEPIRDSTALAVAWEPSAGEHDTEFEVTYSKHGYQQNSGSTMRTKYFNATLNGVEPGNSYDVHITTLSWRSSKICSLPEKKPTTPPSKITCKIENRTIRVEWQRPTKPNGDIQSYDLFWSDVENFRRHKEKLIVVIPQLSYVIEDFKRDPKFMVHLSASNSAGESPFGQCEVDTSKIPIVTWKGDGSDGADASDVEKGIVIGCIISVFVLFILVVFVCWSGCRRHKKRAQAEENRTPYHCSRSSQYPDTISTDVSEQSTRHHQLLKKFIDEETSKESDRGVGMTPKSSRLYLDSEKIPFLPRAANPDGSVDTSCDSQDSGVQGFGTKSSPTSVTVIKVAEKTPLQSEEFVAETIF